MFNGFRIEPLMGPFEHVDELSNSMNDGKFLHN
jgi:hypothetical protein